MPQDQCQFDEASGPEMDGPWTFEAARMDVDMGAIESNVAELRRLVGRSTRIIATLKADAYGHGCVPIGLLLERLGIDCLAVVSLRDAEAMRAAGIGAQIVLLSPLRVETIERVERAALTPTVCDLATAVELDRRVTRRIAIFVKVDCGFGRFGVPRADARELCRGLQRLDRIEIDGIYTHNSFSDPAGRAWAIERALDFSALVSDLAATDIRPRTVQALASPGVFAGLPDPGNAVAVGHLLYGVNPVGPLIGSPAAAAFRPALTAIATRLVKSGPKPPPGEAATYLSGTPGPVGVVPVGISHGYRPVDPEAFVLVSGQPAPILRVCLENTIVDLSRVPATDGDTALLLGTSGDTRISIEMLARWHRTSVLTILTSLGRSLDRRHLGSSGPPE